MHTEVVVVALVTHVHVHVLLNREKFFILKYFFQVHHHSNHVYHTLVISFHIGGSSPHYPYAVPGSLPAILDSPPHFPRGRGSPSPDNMPHEPVHAPFGLSRNQTVPDNMTNRQYNMAESKSRMQNTLFHSFVENN